MNVLDAAEKVLQAAGSPLHYREITQRILQQGLWQTDGKTPEATINARLAVDIAEQSESSRFQRTDCAPPRPRALPLCAARQPQRTRHPPAVPARPSWAARPT